MTSASPTLLEPALPKAAGAVRGTVAEFMLVGGATLGLFPLMWLLRRGLGLDSSELLIGFLAFHAAFVINDPHFSVTYLLFYEKAKERAFGSVYAPLQRARYWIAGFVIPLGLGIWAAVALATRSAPLLGFMLQLMFLLVGWHYVKQGFGVLTVLSARRGVSLSSLERKVFLLHCFAAWAYAWASPADSGKLVQEKGVVYRTLAHGPGLELLTLSVFALSTLALIGVLALKWQRERRLPPLAPLSGFLITVWAWTVFSSADPLMVYLIPALHSVQYLYFVWLLRRNAARAAEGPPRFGRPVRTELGLLAAAALGLGWLLFHAAPSLLDGALIPAGRRGLAEMGDLGVTPYFAAFFAFVNIHHYFMDHVIWRREHPETRFLKD
ncbi:MAG: hypothetical protein IPM35_06595 [Myxococcales bacterium]|nr:hypothetical protein [Myxococcales bacterium]